MLVVLFSGLCGEVPLTAGLPIANPLPASYPVLDMEHKIIYPQGKTCLNKSSAKIVAVVSRHSEVRNNRHGLLNMRE